MNYRWICSYYSTNEIFETNIQFKKWGINIIKSVVYVTEKLHISSNIKQLNTITIC